MLWLWKGGLSRRILMKGNALSAARQWHSILPCRLPFVIQKATARQTGRKQRAILAVV
jgi:hypothetical protein